MQRVTIKPTTRTRWLGAAILSVVRVALLAGCDAGPDGARGARPDSAMAVPDARRDAADTLAPDGQADTPDAPASDSAAAQGDAGPRGDVGVTPVDAATASDAAPDAASTIPGTFAVILTQMLVGSDPSEPHLVSATAGYNRPGRWTPFDMYGFACAFDTVAPCTVVSCTTGAYAAPPAPPPAGDLTITGGLISPPIVLHQQPDGYPGYYDHTALLWRGGETMQLTIAGAPSGIAAATLAVTAPTTVRVTGPTSAVLGAGVDRSRDLDVSWAGTSAGNVLVTISELSADRAHAAALHCGLAAAPGHGAIPSAALTRLAPGMASVAFEQTNTTEMAVSGHRVVLYTNGFADRDGTVPSSFTLR